MMSFDRPLPLMVASVLVAGWACNQRTELPAPIPLAKSVGKAGLVTDFHKLWYRSQDTWGENKLLGISTLQNPMDVWMLQELIVEQKPDFFIECGSFKGGSALMWAMVLDQVHPAGRVISIDIEDKMAEARKLPIAKAKIEFIVGSTTDPELVARLSERVRGKKVLVLLDSDHRKHHVLAELKAYSPMVQVGGYIVVQDTNVNGHPVAWTQGPGPFEAVQEFLARTDAFVVDAGRERLLLTFSPGGYLKRVK
jgi:cephalosporin hydroxylase